MIIETDFNNWKCLYRCKVCGQLWIIDEWDKLGSQFAVKVDDEKDWKEKKSMHLEKELLLHSRGGTTDERCICQGCTNPRVKNIAYCIDHLYELGARK